MDRIPVWKMIREAINSFGEDIVSVSNIIGYIIKQYGDVNVGTIRAQVNACTVNRQSRVGMPENKKPRIADGSYDFLYSVERGLYARFIPAKHGVWEIAEQDGMLVVRMVNKNGDPSKLPRPLMSGIQHKNRNAIKRYNIESPNREAILRYNHAWNNLEGYRAQESALNKLFREFCPENKQLDDVLLKVTALNGFYSTNIFNIYVVSKHIMSLDIDDRLDQGDISLVTDIASGHGVRGSNSGKEKYFYSFATKYCSHHRPDVFPIYDSYVEKLLLHLRDKDRFAFFDQAELRNSPRFKDVILALCDFYSLREFTLKEIDRYLWQYGKEKFSGL